MKAIELFAGIGGSALGVVNAGHDLVAAYEIVPQFVDCFNAQKILPPVAQVSDVGTVEPPECDLVTAGPVCKAFSPGATLFGTGGADDDRNTFPLMFEFIRKAQPRRLLIENSYGIARFKEYVKKLLDALNGMGFIIRWGEIDCYDYGVPQHRRRVVFLCSKSDPWEIPNSTRGLDDPITVGDCLKVPPPPSDPWPLLLPMTEKGRDYFERDPRHRIKHPPLQVFKPSSTVVSIYRKGVPYGVVEADGDLHLCGPRLAARLQSFPDSFDLSGMSKTRALEAIGNAFPGRAVEAMLTTMPR